MPIRISRTRGTAGAAALASLAGLAAAALVPAAATAAGRPAGASWTIVKTVTSKDFPEFTAVTITGPGSGWAFASRSTTGGYLAPAAWRLSGTRWHPAPFPGKPGERVLSAASASPADAWALTSGSRVLHWNGHRWAAGRTFPRPPGSLAVLSSRDVWAGGAWHFDGRRWSQVRSGLGYQEVSAASPGSVWAAGRTSVAHWNGRRWVATSVRTLLPPAGFLSHPRLTGLYARSRTSVWAVGTAGQESQGGPVVILHFDGHHWSRAALADVCCGTPGGVIPDASGGLWIPYGLRASSYQMLHYAAGQVRPAALPAPPGTVLQIAAVAPAPHGGAAFAAGGIYPVHGPEDDFTSALILEYR